VIGKLIQNNYVHYNAVVGVYFYKSTWKVAWKTNITQKVATYSLQANVHSFSP
jgi:hypothetical protein